MPGFQASRDWTLATLIVSPLPDMLTPPRHVGFLLILKQAGSPSPQLLLLLFPLPARASPENCPPPFGAAWPSHLWLLGGPSTFPSFIPWTRYTFLPSISSSFICFLVYFLAPEAPWKLHGAGSSLSRWSLCPPGLREALETHTRWTSRWVVSCWVCQVPPSSDSLEWSSLSACWDQGRWAGGGVSINDGQGRWKENH